MRNEELVQRFVDQELTADERIQFIVALGRDSELRARALELERLVVDAGRLKRPAVPEGFVSRVMAATVEQPAPASTPTTQAEGWRRLVAALWAPRSLQWNLAGATAVACVMLFAVGGLVSLMPPGRDSAGAAPIAQAADVPRAVLVRLVVVRPDARIVQAAGDFNGWNPTQTPLEQTSDGAWTVTLPLEPGRYEYSFVVDGEQWIGDPFAAEQSDDGFGARNAVLEVRAPEAASL